MLSVRGDSIRCCDRRLRQGLRHSIQAVLRQGLRLAQVAREELALLFAVGAPVPVTTAMPRPFAARRKGARLADKGEAGSSFQPGIPVDCADGQYLLVFVTVIDEHLTSHSRGHLRHGCSFLLHIECASLSYWTTKKLQDSIAPEPLPVKELVEADLWDQLPADLPDLLTLLPRADLYLQDEIQFAFHPTLTCVWSRKGRRGQRFIQAPGDNRKVYGFGLVDWREGWFDGRTAPGRTADVFCEQVRAAVARSQRRGRVAIVIADNLKAHTPTGSLLVRGMLTELQEQLYLVYTPAYDPDANRIEWLWRISRRVVTHNHQRSDFDLLLADVETHFQVLTRTPEDVLRHIGSPFAPDKDNDATQPQSQAA